MVSYPKYETSIFCLPTGTFCILNIPNLSVWSPIVIFLLKTTIEACSRGCFVSLSITIPRTVCDLIWLEIN